MSWTKRLTSKFIGQKGEDIATNYLIQHGLLLQQRNFSYRTGEIDIIMKDADVWVFVEVKYRQSANFGGAVAAVSTSKQQKIKQCALFFMQQQGLNAYNTPCRFDVLSLQGELSHPTITWLKNAF